MTNKLGLEEALKKVARSRRVTVNQHRAERSTVRPAQRGNANEEFSEPPSADTVLCVVILIALAVISFFALKWL